MTPLYNMNAINSSSLVIVKLILIIYSIALEKQEKFSVVLDNKFLVSSYLSLLIVT